MRTFFAGVGSFVKRKQIVISSAFASQNGKCPMAQRKRVTPRLNKSDWQVAYKRGFGIGLK